MRGQPSKTAECNVVPVIDAELVRALIADQFPQWSALPVRQVLPGGWDNRTFRLGDELSVRLPSSDGYLLQVEKEQRWLPVLAPLVPLQIPEPVARGVPSAGFPRPWSVYRWIDGEPVSADAAGDPSSLAFGVAGFMNALRRIDPVGGPAPGEHNFWRGAHPEVYASQVDAALAALGDTVDVEGARDVWRATMRARSQRRVWFHGDVAPGNLLLRDGALAAVIDFGTSGVGDPACDLAIAWSVFGGAARASFRTTLGAWWDDELWARGRGWAIWKALIVAAGSAGAHDPEAEAVRARKAISEIIADHRATG